MYVDLPGMFQSPDMVTGPSHRPDLIVIDKSNHMFVVELTAGHEIAVESNVKRKAERYRQFLMDRSLNRTYKGIKFINLVVSTGGVMIAKDSYGIFPMLKKLACDQVSVRYITVKLIEVCIRTSYYLFCMRHDHTPGMFTGD